MKPTFTLRNFILYTLFVPTAFGQNLAGSDDFNDNSKDLAKWGTDQSGEAAVGTLNETNGRLEFSSTTTDYTFRGRPWIKNSASYASDWAVQIDTVVTSDSGNGNFMGFGLEIVSSVDTDFTVGIEHDNDKQSPQYYSYMGLPDPANDIVATNNNALNVGAVRIRFDAALKVLTTDYDSDGPANGYQWTFLASYGIASSGGVTGNADWGMTNTDNFSVSAFGVSSGVVAAAGLTYGDNFVATSPSSLSLQSTTVFTAPKAGTITVPSIVGKTYRMRRSETLSGQWSILEEKPGTGSNLTFPFDDSASSSTRAFYRIEVE